MTFNAIISIENERQTFSTYLSYIYGDDVEDINNVSLSTEGFESINTVKVHMLCNCLYPFRMLMPCKHLISLCVAIDKTGKDMTNRSFLRLVIEYGISDRWWPKMDGTIGTLKSFFHQTNPVQDVSTVEFRNWIKTQRSHHGKTIKLDKRLIYSTLLSNAKSLVESIMTAQPSRIDMSKKYDVIAVYFNSFFKSTTEFFWTFIYVNHQKYVLTISRDMYECHLGCKISIAVALDQE